MNVFVAIPYLDYMTLLHILTWYTFNDMNSELKI